MGTIVVLAVLLVIVYFAARSVIRDKKNGKCSGDALDAVDAPAAVHPNIRHQ